MGSGRLTKKYLQLNHSMRQKLPKGFCKSKRSENRQFKKKRKKGKKKSYFISLYSEKTLWNVLKFILIMKFMEPKGT